MGTDFVEDIGVGEVIGWVSGFEVEFSEGVGVVGLGLGFRFGAG